MKILIASGIYPPDIGGPAQYARNLYETWKSQGHEVKVAAYRWERAFPAFLRHVLYFTKIIRKGWNADLVLVLDTWSAAVPTMWACRMMHKKYMIRTGGDFLWETYIERTGDMVPFKNFYRTSINKLTKKERTVFVFGGNALRGASKVIFSTEWQREIFTDTYELKKEKTCVIENYCEDRLIQIKPENRNFIAATRSLKWKNTDFLKVAFEEARKEVKRCGFPDIKLDTGKAVYDSFLEKMRRSYCVILASIGDISPNMIFDSIRVGVPFIVTKETGIAHRINNAGVIIDPLNKKDIIEKIVWMADPKNRALQAEKVSKIEFKHSWREIAGEIVEVWKKL
ncbi:MAG: glycosyltransferase family 4 protein [Patescibacteria group bacterium]